MNQRLDFVIVGAQKGGSTLLAERIASHPDVWMPAGETRMFRDPLYSPQAVGEFLHGVARVNSSMIRGIKCPDYLGCPESVPRLAALSPAPKILCCLRSPTQRAVSAYFWYVRWGLLPLEDPTVGLSKILDGAYSRTYPQAMNILDWGLYAKHLGVYKQHFKAGEILILTSDELRWSLQNTLNKCFEHIQVSSSVPLEEGPDTVNESVYSPTRLRWLRMRNRLVSTRIGESMHLEIGRPMHWHRRMTSDLIAATDRYVLSRFTSNAPPIIGHEVITALNAYYAHDVAQLRDEFGVTFGGS